MKRPSEWESLSAYSNEGLRTELFLVVTLMALAPGCWQDQWQDPSLFTPYRIKYCIIP